MSSCASGNPYQLHANGSKDDKKFVYPWPYDFIGIALGVQFRFGHLTFNYISHLFFYPLFYGSRHLCNDAKIAVMAVTVAFGLKISEGFNLDRFMPLCILLLKNLFIQSASIKCNRNRMDKFIQVKRKSTKMHNAIRRLQHLSSK